jgi:hypothetical protein
MKAQRASRRRGSGGFTLLVALGVVTLVSLAVLLSYSVVGREAETQGDGRRRKESVFAAEAGLAEGREALRLRMRQSGNTTYGAVLSSLGPAVAEDGLGGGGAPWYELLPGSAAAGGWNTFRLTPEDMPAEELASAGGTPYADYPGQNNVRYRVFVRDDNDDDVSGTVDTNGQVWLIAVGEVLNRDGRPTRSIVQALVTDQNGQAVLSPGCLNRGCGPDNTYNNTQDQTLPTTAPVRTL